ncbi:uncharacterized protein LOC128127045 [Lactuca sativa]|uniref:uncharacterized protein LOC128127045 n=1 Tax=Lactuca sativa TaxID=4236 RepID=UPI0022B070C5|nr:uncharacterized protein LOC128127045 [Lactuca sativa]
MQLLNSPIQQQPLFINLPCNPQILQQQRPQQQFIPQFQGFQQQASPQFQTQSSQVPLSQSQTVNLDNDDVLVQETPQSSRRRQPKGKGKKKAMAWNEEEEEALAKAWIFISCDSRRGNAQTGESFWNRFLDHFHALLGRKTDRSYDAVNGKWRDFRAICTKFHGIFENLKNMRKSGSNDFNILSTACYQFKVTNNGKPFGHQKAWEVCRHGPKWVLNPETSHSDSTTGSNKRARTSESDTGFGLDLNNDIDVAEGDGPPEVLLRQPPGRDKSKQVASSSGKATATNDDRLVESMDKTLSFLEKKIRIHGGSSSPKNRSYRSSNHKLEAPTGSRPRKSRDIYQNPTTCPC